MASASTWKKSAAPRSKTEPALAQRHSGLPAFLLALVALSLLSQPLLAPSLATPVASAAPVTGLPAGGLLSWAVEWVMQRWAAPVPVWPLIAVAANAMFLSLLWRDLAGVFGRGWASGLTLLVGCNPLFLLPIAAGGSQSVGLLAFYGLCRTLRRLQVPVEAFTYLRIAGWLCVLLCLDVQTLALSTMIAPWLLLVMPPQMLRKAPGSFYLVCYLPVVFLFGIWAYVNLTVFNAPWPTLASLAEGSHPLPLPLAAQGSDWAPALRWAVAALAGFPLLLLVARCRSGVLARGVLASVGTVVSAAAVSFVFGWAGFDALVLLWVPAALLLRALLPDQRVQAAGLLALGLLGAAWVQPQGWGTGWRSMPLEEQALSQTVDARADVQPAAPGEAASVADSRLPSALPVVAADAVQTMAVGAASPSVGTAGASLAHCVQASTLTAAQGSQACPDVR
ncbi:hypothetical protein [Xanthomonas maliensis]|uniref:hypothetical protein n=1 Tax=Xanthomonas maliensis TaxID=1321368 RepID=UPI0003B6BE10|nr:hypothetical protein [Xanthomonas maliensis]KAB7765487.1 hypothetical protein CKY51_15335 [Xanthomonas maliensis]